MGRRGHPTDKGGDRVSLAQLELGSVARAAEIETLDERFRDFVNARPDVVKLLAKMARELVELGEGHFGIKMLFEVARHRHLVKRSVGSREPWLLNNSYASRMARLLEATYPDLKGVFTKRALAEERV